MGNGKISLREIYRFSNGMEMVDGALCWNLVGLSEEIKAGMRECKKLGTNPESARIDTWAVDFVLLDKQGHVLGKTAGYRDRRTEGIDLKICEWIPREELYRKADIQRQIFSTVYQLVAVKEKQPDILSQVENFLMTPDYLNFPLIGVRRQGYTNATTTQLINSPERTQDRKLIETLGYPQRLFGRLSMPGTVAGRLSKDVQKETGPDCRAVFPTIYDTDSTVATILSNQDHVPYVSSGTWPLMGTELRDAGCREVSVETNSANEGGYECRYRFLKNIVGLWMIRSVKKEWKESGEDYSFGEICKRASYEAISSIVGCNDNRSLAPEGMCKVVRIYCEESGQQVPETKWEVTAVIYDSLADCYRIRCRGIGALTGARHNCIHIAGGGANMDYLSRLTAEATGKTVHVGPTEATVIGNLAMQMIEGKGFRSLRGAKDSISCSFEIEAYEPSEKV